MDIGRHNRIACSAVSVAPVGRTYSEHVAHDSEVRQPTLANLIGECGILGDRAVASVLLPLIQALLV